MSMYSIGSMSVRFKAPYSLVREPAVELPMYMSHDE